MSYNSIIPDGYVPTRECVDWLHNEAQKFFDAQGEACRKYFNHPPLERVFAHDEWKHIQKLGSIAQMLQNSYLDASNRWINQPAFDWMKGGDF